MKLIFENNNLSVISLLKNNPLVREFRKIPFEKIRDDVLNKKYELSINIVGKDKIKSLNSKYRNKDKATDVLSFSINKYSGEIFLCPLVAKIKSKYFDMNNRDYLIFLIIHSLLHLKGFEHGDKMEKIEKRYLKKFLN